MASAAHRVLDRWGRRWTASLLGAAEGGDFRRLWAGDTITQASTQVTGLLVPLLAVGRLDASAFQMGLLATAETLAFLLIGLPAGAWVDRLPKRGVLLWANVVRAGALLTLPAALLAGVLSFHLVLSAAAVVGVATVFFDVAYQSYLPSLLPAHRLGEGNAKLQVSASVAQVAGPAAGGALARLFGAPGAIAMAGAAYLAATAATARIAHREVLPARAPGATLRAEVAEGLAFVVRQPLLRRVVATTATSNLFGGISAALLVLYAVRRLGLSQAQLGLTLSAGALGGLAGALSAQAVAARFGQGRTIAWALVPTLPFLALVPLADGRPPVAAAALMALSAAVAGTGTVIYNVAQVTYRQRLCPAALLGRMNASVRFVVWGVLPIGSFTGGLLGTHLGLVAALWVSVAGQALGVLPVLLSPLATTGDLSTRTGDAPPPASG